MQVTIETDGGVAVVVVSGSLDAAHADDLAAELGRLLAAGTHDFVIDMSDVGVLDGSGLAVLVNHFKRVRIGPGDVRLCGLQSWVKVMFSMTRLNRVFAAFDDRSAAVASFAPADGA